jgi:plasmid maintenance system antidote protein VapI
MSDKFWLVWCDRGVMPPTVKHPTEQHARDEAERLARKYAGETFHVLAPVDSVVQNSMVWTTWHNGAADAPRSCETGPLRPGQRPSHPGKIADEERKARGWFHGELADRLRWNRDFTDMWLQGDIREMSEINFIDLNRVFGPSPDFWRKLYEAWRDWKPARRDCNTCRYLKSTPQDSACWACSDAEPLWHPKGVTP